MSRVHWNHPFPRHGDGGVAAEYRDGVLEVTLPVEEPKETALPIEG